MAILDIALAWRTARLARLEKEKEVEDMKITEKDLKAKVIAALRKSKNKAISDGTRLFQLETTDEPTPKDWPTIYEHVKKTGNFELLYKRLNAAAVKERWELGEEVPGVGKIPVETLSDTKAK